MLAKDLVWLDRDSSRDLTVWSKAWAALPERSPYYHPSFVEALAPGDRRPAAVYYESSDGSRILYPLWVGELNELEICPRDLGDRCDLVSPYGYGGPLYHGAPALREKTGNEFVRLFRAACQEHGVISEFVREDIFEDHIVHDEGERIHRQANVVVRLGLTEEEHLSRYEHKVRKNVRRAREEGLRVIFDERGERLDEFLEIYHSTMTNAGAEPYFFFGRDVFEKLVGDLGPERGLAFVHVLDGERVVSTELILCSRHRLYSFLGGTRQESKHKRPNDLLKHEIILWGGKMGFRFYILGGGAKPGDGIFQFKKAFDPGSALPFFTRQRIHDPEAYERLVAARAAIQPEPLSGFFPAYRG
jgi:hypothetical protein